MKLLLINQTKDRLPKLWLEKWIKGLSRRLFRLGYKSIAKQELVVVFVSPKEIRRLNHSFRGKDYATDVLSFQSDDEASVGELVLSNSVIAKQSKRTGLTEQGELGYMLVHGVLHLLGFDHEIKKDELEMFALQDSLYASLVRYIGFSSWR